MDGIQTKDTELSVPIRQSREVQSFGLHPETERALKERYSRSFINKDEIIYEFTRDPALLHQYYILREQMFINVWGLKHFEAKEDEYDNLSHILVARKGNQVIGGARLTVSTARRPLKLPMEGEDFNIAEAFPELNLSQRSYGGISRLIVLPEFSKENITLEMIKNLYRKSVAMGLSYWFAVSPKSDCAHLLSEVLEAWYSL